MSNWQSVNAEFPHSTEKYERWEDYASVILQSPWSILMLLSIFFLVKRSFKTFELQMKIPCDTRLCRSTNDIFNGKDMYPNKMQLTLAPK